MPVETVGFYMKPFSFFSMNPGVDVPSTPNKASVLVDKNVTSNTDALNITLKSCCGINK